MEIGIVAAGLGLLYIVKNKDQENGGKKSTESFKNRYNSQLPNTNTPPENFPIENLSDLKYNVRNYPNGDQATSKYFLQETILFFF